MALLGKEIRLTGKSQKGKNRVRQFGERWHVLAETERVLFSPGLVGPWLFISPIGTDQSHKASRWVKATDDPDFEVVLLS